MGSVNPGLTNFSMQDENPGLMEILKKSAKITSITDLIKEIPCDISITDNSIEIVADEENIYKIVSVVANAIALHNLDFLPNEIMLRFITHESGIFLNWTVGQVKELADLLS